MFLTEDIANIIAIYFVSTGDFMTPMDGYAPEDITVIVRKRGDDAWMEITPPITNVGEGEYVVRLTAGDCDRRGLLSLKATAPGAVPWYDQHQIVKTLPGEESLSDLVAVAKRASYEEIADQIAARIDAL